MPKHPSVWHSMENVRIDSRDFFVVVFLPSPSCVCIHVQKMISNLEFLHLYFNCKLNFQKVDMRHIHITNAMVEVYNGH